MKRSCSTSSRQNSRQSLRVLNDDKNHPKHRKLSATSRTSVGSRTSFGYRPSVGGRPSMEGRGRLPVVHNEKGRTSAYGRNNLCTLKKDPRPVGDRKYRDRCIRELLEFLMDRDFPHQLSVKQLQSPSCKDFVRIFEFLVQQLNSNYQVKGKHEEEIPRMLKEELLYPFPISKASMYSPGSPHTWPNLLAALTWMRERIQHLCTTDVDELIFPKEDCNDFDHMPEKQILVSYAEQAYKEFLAGSDTFEALEEQLAKKLRGGTGITHIDDLDGEITRLDAELNTQQSQLEREHEHLSSLKNKASTHRDDMTKLDTYMDQMASRYRTVEQQLGCMKIEGDRLKEEHETLSADLTRKQHIYDTQELSQGDIQKMNQGHENLRRQIDSVTNEMAETDKHVWKTEINIGKINDQIETNITDGNKVLNQLGLVCEEDLQLNSRTVSNVTHYETVLLPAALEHLREVKRRNNEIEEEKFKLAERIDQLTVASKQKDKECKNVENEIKEIDKMIETKRKENEETENELQEQINKYKESIRKMHLSKSSTLQAVVEKLEMEKRRLEQNEKERQEELKKAREFLIRISIMFIDHKETVQKDLEAFQQELRELTQLEK